MELQRTPKSGNSEKSDNREGTRQPGSVPMTNAELSMRILENEQEDRRQAATEPAKKHQIVDEKSQCHGSGSTVNNQPVANVHLYHNRGCKYYLPSADPIPIPTIPYDPLDKRWQHQELRRRRGYLMKKTNKALCELAEDGFGIQFLNDFDDDVENELGEQYVDYCPACSSSLEEGNHEIEITVGQVIKIAIDQEIEITVDQDIEIAEDAAAIITSTEPAAQETQASTTANRIKSYIQRFLNFRGTISSAR